MSVLCSRCLAGRVPRASFALVYTPTRRVGSPFAYYPGHEKKRKIVVH